MKLWLSVPFCLHLILCSPPASDLGVFSVQLCRHHVPSWRVASQPAPVALIFPSFLSSASGFGCSPWVSLYVQVPMWPSLIHDLFTGDCLHLLGFLIMLVSPISLSLCVCVCGCVNMCTMARRGSLLVYCMPVQCLALGTASYMDRWMTGGMDGLVNQWVQMLSEWNCALWFLISSFFVMGQNEYISMG